MIAASMPSGVEHSVRAAGQEGWHLVIAASMPSGVEHKSVFAALAGANKVIAASMPSGVEHLADGPVCRFSLARDRRIDAFGR